MSIDALSTADSVKRLTEESNRITSYAKHDDGKPLSRKEIERFIMLRLAWCAAASVVLDQLSQLGQ